MNEYSEYLQNSIKKEENEINELKNNNEMITHSTFTIILHEYNEFIRNLVKKSTNNLIYYEDCLNSEYKQKLTDLKEELEQLQNKNENILDTTKRNLDSEYNLTQNILLTEIVELETLIEKLIIEVKNKEALVSKFQEELENENHTNESKIEEVERKLTHECEKTTNDMKERIVNEILQLNKIIESNDSYLLNEENKLKEKIEYRFENFKKSEFSKRERALKEIQINEEKKMRELKRKREVLIKNTEKEIEKESNEYNRRINEDLQKEEKLLKELESKMTDEKKELLNTLNNDKLNAIKIATKDLDEEIKISNNEISELSLELNNQVEIGKNKYKELLKLQEIILKYDSGIKEEIDRRFMYNCQILDLKGNIRVYCRVRPISPIEYESGESTNCVSYPIEGEIILKKDSNQHPDHFTFDEVFTQNTTQDQIYYEVEPYISKLLEGFNVCIFAYGQTGSGKTYTMEGDPSNPGVNIRSLLSLFTLSKEKDDRISYRFSISIIEIYNETVRDLLSINNEIIENSEEESSSTSTISKKKVKIRTNKKGDLLIENCEKKEISSYEEALFYLDKGHSKRFEASHLLNEHSSRSHFVVTVSINGKQSNGSNIKAKLNLIDLAGSERVNKTEAAGDRLNEAKYINKSLSALGNVIKAIGDPKATHIPYRDSKLTRLLSSSLANNSKVLMFVTISPALYNYQESISSLQFASRCRKIDLNVSTK